MKKIVYYGAGKIAEQLCYYYDNLIPEFFIDTYSEKSTCFGRKIYKLENVSNLSNYFIIVTTFSYTAIRDSLKKKGLKENENFCFYKDYFNIDKESLDDKLKEITTISKKSILISGPFFTGRKTKETCDFFKTYSSLSKEKCVFLSHLTVLSKERACHLLGGEFIALPDFTNWQGFKREQYNFEEIRNILRSVTIAANERNDIQNIESYHNVADRLEDFDICILIYKYYKFLLEIIKPVKIVVGTDIKQEYAILAYLAKKNNIPYVFWEYGWIPGTYIFEQDGNAGRSRLATEKTYFASLKNGYKTNHIRKIIESILSYEIQIQNKLTENDAQEISKINSDKKTVFLVGSGFSSTVNGKSDFSHTYISPFFDSEDEIIEEISFLCEKNNWNLIYKPHPGLIGFQSYDKFKDNVIWVKDADVNYLIRKADIVISLYSAADCMVLMYGKPLVQIGKSILNYADCTYKPSNKKDIELKMQSAMKRQYLAEYQKNFENFIGMLLSNCSWDDLSKKKEQYGLTFQRDFFDIL